MRSHHLWGVRYLKLTMVVIGLSVWTLPAQAIAIYNFTSAPITVESLQHRITRGSEEVITDRSMPIPDAFSSEFRIGDSLHASLSFNEPLRVSTRTDLHAESGNESGIFFEPTEGDLIAYSASSSRSGYPITSDLDAYNPTTDLDGMITVDRYSVLDGHVITDSLGNISGWELHFSLLDGPSGSSITIDPTSPGSLGGLPDVLLDIRSGPAELDKIPNVIKLDAAIVSLDYDFDRVDRALYDPGNREYKSYTAQPGSFVAINQVPTSGTLPLLLVALLGWGLFEKSGRNRRSSPNWLS